MEQINEELKKMDQEDFLNKEEERSPMMENKKGSIFTNWWHALNMANKIITVILAIIVVFLFYVSLDANKYQAVVHVIEGDGKVGVNPTTERLDFGDLSRGTSATRTVTVDNETFMPMYVMVLKFGSISDLVKLDHNYFRLTKGQSRKIEFSVYMPASAPIDSNYSGRVILFKIPTFGL